MWWSFNVTRRKKKKRERDKRRNDHTYSLVLISLRLEFNVRMRSTDCRLCSNVSANIAGDIFRVNVLELSVDAFWWPFDRALLFSVSKPVSFCLNSNVLQDIRLFFSSLTPHHWGNEKSGISIKVEYAAVTVSAASAEQISPCYWQNWQARIDLRFAFGTQNPLFLPLNGPNWVV